MPLSHFAISKAAPKEKPYKLSDGSGLHLLVEPNGSKKWRFRYHFEKREKMIALGTYPATSIADVIGNEVKVMPRVEEFETDWVTSPLRAAAHR